MTYIAIYNAAGTEVIELLTISEYLERVGRIEITDVAVTCSLI